VPTNSFSWWAINFGISAVWVAGSVASHNYFLAIGGIIYLGVMMLIELPDTSSAEGTAEEPAKLVFPPESATEGPLHSEAELGGEPQGPWRGAGPPQTGAGSQGTWSGSGPPPR